MVDTISGVGSQEYEHDAWGIDVSVGGSQKALMLPPGLSSTRCRKSAGGGQGNPQCGRIGIGRKSLHSTRWAPGPYTPAVNLLYGLKEAISMLEQEGLDNVFARHKRHGAATRAAVKAWGLENPVPGSACAFAGADRGANAGRPWTPIISQGGAGEFDMSLGTGLNKIRARRSASVISAISTIDADGDAVGRRDGSRSRQGAASQRRGAGRHGSPERTRCGVDAESRRRLS